MLPNSTFEALELSVEMTPAEDFLKFNPPSRLDFSRENFQNPIRRGGGGVWIFSGTTQYKKIANSNILLKYYYL